MVAQAKEFTNRYGMTGIIFAAFTALVMSMNSQSAERETQCQAQLKDNAQQMRDIAKNDIEADRNLAESFNRLAEKIEVMNERATRN